MKIVGFFAKERNQNDGIIDKCFPLDLVKAFSKVFICLGGLPQPQHSILNAYSLLVLEDLVTEPSHMPKAIQVNGLELVMKNLDNLFLRKARKKKANICDFKRNLTYDIVFLHPRSFWSLGYYHNGCGCGGVCCNAGVRFPSY